MSLTLDTPAVPSAAADLPLRSIRPNIVQSIRAFRVQELQDAAQALNKHFLYANLANAQTKQDVLDLIGQQFMLAHRGILEFIHQYLPKAALVMLQDLRTLQPQFMGAQQQFRGP